MATWSDFENAEPEMAEAGKKLLYQFGVGLAFLATVRKDGAPRLHPICPTVVNGRLYALIVDSHKRNDLRRDGRYALHTFPPVDVDDEFLVMGRAKLIEDPEVAEMVRKDQVARGMTSTNDELAFEFGIERAMHAKYPGGHGTWPPKYSIWKER
ncbi:MAG: pyridoxamine 5'-phosphate oxidase family protein [Candidatus Binatus sp.]|uniref:pyridoxamine 5'-phosphate oxidase family protein n=1 Tax=Candidatus Binatus sp. TaxID=2811406 RepID=UPI0027191D15|nr:pyridoxamine 5'-phosphate oxidase family protein [Candidatus Binatus sp.]MDO8431705.1 pyridoxamine 5'-phosphate oxidase family protein [Candidatus Binatus sp.]